MESVELYLIQCPLQHIFGIRLYKTFYEPYQIDVNIFCPCCAQPQVCGSAVRWGRVPSNGGCTRPAAQKLPENADGDSHTYPSHPLWHFR